MYGLGVNALDHAAVATLFTAKQRPSWDPLIVHIAGPDQLRSLAAVTSDAERLIEAFWPGPLTLLLPRTPAIPDAVTAGRPLVGLRMPAHPVALDLLRQAALPIAAPSANRFGHTSPTTAAHVLADLDGRIDAVLDGGPTQVGLESTVLDPQARIVYRPGAITPGQIAAVLGHPVSFFDSPGMKVAPESLPSPGVGMRHYAPAARLILVEGSGHSLHQATTAEAVKGLRAGVMLPEHWSAHPATVVFPWGNWNDLETLARNLFAGLRLLDQAGVEVILCPLPPQQGLGAAIHDRLQKAARQ